MLFNSPTYGKWRQTVMQQIPDDCESRLSNMLWLMTGMYASESVHLNKIARSIPLRAKKLSIVRRLRRFLNNEAVDVEAWYRPWAKWLIKSASSDGKLHLVVDTTKVSAHHRLLMVSVAYHRRTLPLMWDWVEYSRGRCTTQLQCDLLKRLDPLIPSGVRVSIVGDSEFNHPDLIELLKGWSWDYALRQKGNTVFQQAESDQWQSINSLPIKPGQVHWFEDVALTATHQCSTTLLLYWKEGEKQPWYLATNQSCPLETTGLYNRRVWIEEMFGDMKGHGFDLELSRLQTPARLSRLTLVVAILYVWLVSLGEMTIQFHLTDEIDRTDRRDLSIFRLGWDWLARRLALNDPFPLLLHPNFCLVSGC